MLLKNEICTKMIFLANDLGFEQMFEKVSNINCYIVFKKSNIEIRFSVEEMENYFDMQIILYGVRYNYSISDKPGLWEECNSNIGDTRFIYKNIFEFVDNINEEEFHNKKIELYKKSRNLFTGNKAMLEIIELYKNILMDSLDNITSFEKR